MLGRDKEPTPGRSVLQQLQVCWKSFPGSCSLEDLGCREAGGGEALQPGGAGGKEGVTLRHWERSCSQGGQLGAELELGSSGQMAELDAEAKEKEGNYSQREGGRGRA